MNLKPEQIESEKIEPNDSVDSESNNLNDFKIQQMESFILSKKTFERSFCNTSNQKTSKWLL